MAAESLPPWQQKACHDGGRKLVAMVAVPELGEKKPYYDQEAAEREHFERQSAEADAAALAMQETRRRHANELASGEERSARRKSTESTTTPAAATPKPLLSAAQLERQATQLAETLARRQEWQKEEDALKKQHGKDDSMMLQKTQHAIGLKTMTNCLLDNTSFYCVHAKSLRNLYHTGRHLWRRLFFRAMPNAILRRMIVANHSKNCDVLR